jgi:D-glycero-alpha-D-manno-heptose 1-phosphate guanylyltransferase
MALSIVVLAGGQGTRMRSVLGDTPKLLALINDVPFINYLLKWLDDSFDSIDYQVFIATGYGHDQIKNYIALNSLSCILIREQKPLGTLGAAAHAAEHLEANDVLVINGDTLFACNFKQAYSQFLSTPLRPLAIVKASLTNDRYGGYIIDAEGHHLVAVSSNSTLISLGALFTTRSALIASRDIAIQAGITEPMMDNHFINPNRVYPFVLPEDTPFIDIGTPSSYAKAHMFIPESSFGWVA